MNHHVAGTMAYAHRGTDAPRGVGPPRCGSKRLPSAGSAGESARTHEKLRQGIAPEAVFVTVVQLQSPQALRPSFLSDTRSRAIDRPQNRPWKRASDALKSAGQLSFNHYRDNPAIPANYALPIL
jgi:hypothetical protein